MKRLIGVYCGLALAIAGCGNNGTGGGGSGSPDLTMVGGKVDMVMVGSPDIAMVSGANTGEPCAKNMDCAKGLGPNQNPACTKSQMLEGGKMVVWDGGYCTSPCRMSRNDANNN